MRNALAPILALTALTLFGTIGFRTVSGRDWIDSLYLAVITIATVGCRDPASDRPTMLFTILYIISGLGIFTYCATRLGTWIVSAEFQHVLGKRRMNRRIDNLSDHSIVCGFGRMGRTICQCLHNRKRPFVVVDINESRLADECTANGWQYIVGDVTHDDVLRRAGVDRATALTTVLPTDADNLYVVLSARILNPGLQIIARASDEKAIDKLERAGATRVVSPVKSGAEKMARFMLNPGIEDFLEIADGRGGELELADVIVQPASPYAGKSLKETDLKRWGLMVVSICRPSGERLMPPSGDAIIHSGDSLLVLGSPDAINSILHDTAE